MTSGSITPMDGVDVPTHWYNVVADLPFALPADRPPPSTGERTRTIKPQIPLALIRQSSAAERDIAIPEEIRALYRTWRPTPLIRAERLERQLGTKARIYYKYEGGNISGSHKLATAQAQAFYYKAAGAKRLTTGTGAGQWGTALASACHSWGLGCKVYMVASSYASKPHRKTIMRMLGAQVEASPSAGTPIGIGRLSNGRIDESNIAFAVTEALADAMSSDGSHLSVGSGEAYSILHSTVIGLEAREQLARRGEKAEIVLASLGAGSNFGGIALPFLAERLRHETSVRCISVESTACPKLTKGVYRYDYTDGSGITALQKMYTLGSDFRTSRLHAGGLRYHACSKVISALYHERLTEAVAYDQQDVFESAALFSRLEGIVPAPEAAHSVHGAIEEARRADREGRRPTILFCLSGHGLYDLAAYDDYLESRMERAVANDDEIRTALENLPRIDH